MPAVCRLAERGTPGCERSDGKLYSRLINGDRGGYLGYATWRKYLKLAQGYTAVHPAEGEMFLLFVHPGHAGRGIGRTLLAAAHEALRAAGCREAFLFTHEQNERALTVYGAAGYRPDGSIRVSDFRGTQLRELRLVKQL